MLCIGAKGFRPYTTVRSIETSETENFPRLKTQDQDLTPRLKKITFTRAP
uniref:Uncharacterized protein n=1 Tax=Meloidogyne enterolobii TaxID=390850 RepID=A0A6V7V0L1_MELEN|nr:unnamed protein product [Meloidogyne enterolobii]